MLRALARQHRRPLHRGTPGRQSPPQALECGPDKCPEKEDGPCLASDVYSFSVVAAEALTAGGALDHMQAEANARHALKKRRLKAAAASAEGGGEGGEQEALEATRAGGLGALIAAVLGDDGHDEGGGQGGGGEAGGEGGEGSGLRPRLPAWCPPALKEELPRAWMADPLKRPTFRDLQRAFCNPVPAPAAAPPAAPPAGLASDRFAD